MDGISLVEDRLHPQDLGLFERLPRVHSSLGEGRVEINKTLSLRGTRG